MSPDGLHREVVISGTGRAGLSMSPCLAERGVDHIVLERDEAGHEWRDRRWDTFCLVGPPLAEHTTVADLRRHAPDGPRSRGDLAGGHARMTAAIGGASSPIGSSPARSTRCTAGPERTPIKEQPA